MYDYDEEERAAKKRNRLIWKSLKGAMTGFMAALMLVSLLINLVPQNASQSFVGWFVIGLILFCVVGGGFMSIYRDIT